MDYFWYWLCVGLILITAEMFGTAGFLLAIGMAAIATSLLVLLIHINIIWQLVCFSALCIISAIGWWYIIKQQNAKNLQTVTINQPLIAMIGRITILTEPIENGRGKIRINDANWFVTGPELPKDSKVKIIGIENGSLLIVELIDNSINI